MKEKIARELDEWIRDLMWGDYYPTGQDIVEKLNTMQALDLREEVYEMHCDGVKVVKR